MITHETRIREVPGSNPVVFSGFLNLKIAKELVIFKDKYRVGPHIPLLFTIIDAILFNVYSFS